MIKWLPLATALAAAGTLAIPQSSVPSGSPDAQAWGVLKQGFEDSDVEHRKKAIGAIGTIGDVPEAVQMVERGLQDKDRMVRQISAATLGEMGSRDAIPYLKAALDDGPEVSFSRGKVPVGARRYKLARDISTSDYRRAQRHAG